MLLANYKAAESQGNQRLAALEAVITRLQITMTDVGATAARVARENKLLSAENRQLTTERAKHLEMQQQLQVGSVVVFIITLKTQYKITDNVAV